MEINVNIKIGTTPELGAMLSALAGAWGKSQAQPAAEAEPAGEAAGTVAETQPAGETAGTVAEPAGDAAGTVADEPGGDAPGTVAEPSLKGAAYARQAMDELRRRIEGEDYKDNPDAPGRVKYHSQLTAFFKALALQLGGIDKPTKLTDEQLRKFADECAATTLGETGEIVTPIPF